MSARPTNAELDALIEELTVDAYGDDEQLGGFLVGAEDALVKGERALLIGIEVEVVKLNAGPDLSSGLLARVRREGRTYEVTLTDLTFLRGSELGTVVAALRRWQGRK